METAVSSLAGAATVVVIAGEDKASAVGETPGAGAAVRAVRRASDRPFLDIPERSEKPRERGLTHVIDRGLSVAEVDGLLEVAGGGRGHRQARLGHGAGEREPEGEAGALRGARDPGRAGGDAHRAGDQAGQGRGVDRVAEGAGPAPRRGLRRHDRAGGGGEEPPDPIARRERVSSCCRRSAARTRTSSWRRMCGWSRSNATCRRARGR